MSKFITNNLALWSSALLDKSSAGRGSNERQEAYGIKKLRELILELAMRGKMVAQDSNDQPASTLLEQIGKEKARRRRAEDVKEERPLPGIRETDKPFALPHGWEWVRFGSIAQHNSGKTLDRGRNTGQLRDYVTTSNLYWGRFDLDNIRQMPIGDDELEKCKARKGDLLICEGGEAGRAAVWPYDKDICFQNHVHRARFYGGIDPYFAYRFFEKLNATGEIDQHRKGVGISNMSSKTLASIVVPLPPVAEQHRIVAKVAELMALCDQLEQQQTHSIEAHQTLVETLLATLTSADSPQELTEAWTLIASNCDTLFITEHSVDELTQTILQLAVMGKLVPQDPNDEPVTELLENVVEEKRQLIEIGQMREKEGATPISNEESPFDVPPNWKWARLSEITRRIHYGYTASARPEIKSVRLLRITDIQDNTVDWSSVPGCEIEDSVLPQFQLELGDILVARTGGTVGKSYLVSEIPLVAVFASYLIRIQGASALFVRYLKLFLESPTYWQQLVEGARGGAQPNVNGQTLGRMVVPVPPRPEQQRIVAKVDELMALCDALKARIADAQTTQVNLADAIVEQAVA